MTNKRELSEQDICTQYILPALVKSGWDVSKQVREQVYFTDGRMGASSFGRFTIYGKM